MRDVCWALTGTRLRRWMLSRGDAPRVPRRTLPLAGLLRRFAGDERLAIPPPLVLSERAVPGVPPLEESDGGRTTARADCGELQRPLCGDEPATGLGCCRLTDTSSNVGTAGIAEPLLGDICVHDLRTDSALAGEGCRCKPLFWRRTDCLVVAPGDTPLGRLGGGCSVADCGVLSMS